MTSESAPFKRTIEYENDLGERVQELVDLVWGVNAPEDKVEEGYRRCAEFARMLQKKYPEYRRYRVYHALVGGSLEDVHDINEDFPGEDSVVAFLEKLVQERNGTRS